jgi:hypothetical protein
MTDLRNRFIQPRDKKKINLADIVVYLLSATLLGVSVWMLILK